MQGTRVLILGQETKILHAAWHDKEKKKKFIKNKHRCVCTKLRWNCSEGSIQTLTRFESFPGDFNVQLGLRISALPLATHSYILKTVMVKQNICGTIRSRLPPIWEFCSVLSRNLEKCRESDTGAVAEICTADKKQEDSSGRGKGGGLR